MPSEAPREAGSARSSQAAPGWAACPSQGTQLVPAQPQTCGDCYLKLALPCHMVGSAAEALPVSVLHGVLGVPGHCWAAWALPISLSVLGDGRGEVAGSQRRWPSGVTLPDVGCHLRAELWGAVRQRGQPKCCGSPAASSWHKKPLVRLITAGQGHSHADIHLPKNCQYPAKRWHCSSPEKTQHLQSNCGSMSKGPQLCWKRLLVSDCSQPRKKPTHRCWSGHFSAS